MNIIRKNFSRDYFSKNFNGKYDTNRNIRRLREIIKRKDKGKLMEIGCGRGGFVKLASRFFNTEGVDVSKYATDYAKKYTGKNIKQVDVEKEKLIRENYDVIAAFNVFEHLEKTQEVADNIHKSLKKQGILIGSVPNNFGIIGKFNTLLTNFFDRTHKSTYTPAKWMKILKNAGFKKIRFFGEVTFSNHNVMYIKSNLWKYLSFNLIFICTKL
jgi:2-polyprenyl-3-methyl-5-hydroxy-6-metoxy-1,4-benzoquinol methylase